MIDKSCLVDSNILVYSEDYYSPFYQPAKQFLEENLSSKTLMISQQNIIEFFAILTDQKRTSHPVGAKECISKIESWLSSGFYKLITPSSNAQVIMANLLEKFPAKGQEIFDIFLAATMLDNGVDSICTADVKIFKTLGFQVINPLD